MLRRDVEFHLADAARAANIPIGVSGASAAPAAATRIPGVARQRPRLEVLHDHGAVRRQLADDALPLGCGQVDSAETLNFSRAAERLHIVQPAATPRPRR